MSCSQAVSTWPWAASSPTLGSTGLEPSFRCRAWPARCLCWACISWSPRADRVSPSPVPSCADPDANPLPPESPERLHPCEAATNPTGATVWCRRDARDSNLVTLAYQSIAPNFRFSLHAGNLPGIWWSMRLQLLLLLLLLLLPLALLLSLWAAA